MKAEIVFLSKALTVTLACIAGWQLLANSKAGAAGTVAFNNTSSTLVINGVSSNPVVPADLVHAMLYWAPGGSNSFSPIGASVNVGIPIAGAFAGGTRTAGAGTAAGSITQFQVRAWSGSDTSYEDALQHTGVLIGQSQIFQVQTSDPDGGGGGPPTPPISITGPFTSFTLMPNTNVAIVSPPVLFLTRTGGTLTVFWSTNAQGFSLETNNDLTRSIWTFAGNPTVAGTNNTFTLPLGTDTNFFRLRKP